MLIRKQNGNVFHIVGGETKNGLAYLCLCGAVVVRNCEEKQLLPDGYYVRCQACRKIQNDAILKSRGLARGDGGGQIYYVSGRRKAHSSGSE